jgi:hypothetical protein
MQLFRGEIVKQGILLGTTLALAGACLLAAPAVSEGQGRDPEAQRRRNQIRIMEGVLVQAVRLGAEHVSREMEKFEPAGSTVLLGMPRARGFVLDGHGVFFDVEIPDMNQSLVWSVMMVQRERQVGNALDSLRAALKSMPDGPTLQQAQVALQAVEKTIGPPPSAKVPAEGQPPRGQVGAATAVLHPDILYAEAVKDALVDVMLDHSLQMRLGADEWLTVAARDNGGAMSGALSDSVTITLRVKGSDLATYHAGPDAVRGEIRNRVKSEAKVF